MPPLNRRQLLHGLAAAGARAALPAGPDRERIDFLVSTDPASPFVIDLYRLGYYRGTGGRHLLRLGPFDGKAQPTPPVGPERLRWTSSAATSSWQAACGRL